MEWTYWHWGHSGVLVHTDTDYTREGGRHPVRVTLLHTYLSPDNGPGEAKPATLQALWCRPARDARVDHSPGAGACGIPLRNGSELEAA